MPFPDDSRRIGTISNYYGCLEVKQEGSCFYWAIENYGGYYWEEIPEHLFAALNQFQDDQEHADG